MSQKLSTHQIAVLRLARYIHNLSLTNESGGTAAISNLMLRHGYDLIPTYAYDKIMAVMVNAGVNLSYVDRTLQSLESRGYVEKTSAVYFIGTNGYDDESAYQITESGRIALDTAMQAESDQQFVEMFSKMALEFLHSEDSEPLAYDAIDHAYGRDYAEPCTIIRGQFGTYHIFGGDQREKIVNNPYPIVPRGKNDVGYFEVGDHVTVNAYDDITGLHEGDFGKITAIEYPSGDRQKTLITLRCAGFNGDREYALFAEQLEHNLYAVALERREKCESEVFLQMDTDYWSIIANLPVDQRIELDSGSAVLTTQIDWRNMI